MKLPKPKFNIGDKVYLILKTYDEYICEKCHTCNGQGNVYQSISDIAYKPIKCNICNGIGEINRWVVNYKIIDESCIIIGIDYTPINYQWDTYLDFEDYEYIYNVSYICSNDWDNEYLEEPDKYKETKIFSNKEDAQVECDTRNSNKNNNHI